MLHALVYLVEDDRLVWLLGTPFYAVGLVHHPSYFICCGSGMKAHHFLVD